MNPSKTAPKIRTSTLVTLAVLTAIAFAVMMVFRIPIFAAFSLSFLKFDLKDVVIAIGGFIYGPLASAAISVVVSFLEMVTVSESGPIGFIMNVLSTCAFVCPAAFIYKRRRGLSGAVIGLVVGVLAMTAVMVLWNWIITPIYTGMPREAVAAMLLPLFAPFNLIKGGINAAATMLLYKPVVGALRKARLAPEAEGPKGGAAVSVRNQAGVIVVSVVVLATCVLLVLALQGTL